MLWSRMQQCLNKKCDGFHFVCRNRHIHVHQSDIRGEDTDAVRESVSGSRAAVGLWARVLNRHLYPLASRPVNQLGSPMFTHHAPLSS